MTKGLNNDEPSEYEDADGDPNDEKGVNEARGDVKDEKVAAHHRIGRVGNRDVYYCTYGSCSVGGGKKYWDLRMLNMHRMVDHQLPFVTPRKRGRSATRQAQPKRPPPPPDKLKMYNRKRENDVEYQMRVRYNTQRRRVIQRVCTAYGKKNYLELPHKAKEEVKVAMQSYNIEERKEERRKKILILQERKKMDEMGDGQQVNVGPKQGTVDLEDEALPMKAQDDAVPPMPPSNIEKKREHKRLKFSRLLQRKIQEETDDDKPIAQLRREILNRSDHRKNEVFTRFLRPQLSQDKNVIGRLWSPKKSGLDLICDLVAMQGGEGNKDEHGDRESAGLPSILPNHVDEERIDVKVIMEVKAQAPQNPVVTRATARIHASEITPPSVHKDPKKHLRFYESVSSIAHNRQRRR